jgi:hypothetical protein
MSLIIMVGKPFARLPEIKDFSPVLGRQYTCSLCLLDETCARKQCRFLYLLFLKCFLDYSTLYVVCFSFTLLLF